MRQGSLGRHPGGLQKASGSSLPSDGLRWASDGRRMSLRWASDGSRMELGWASESLRWVSDGQQKGSRMFKMKLLWSPTNPRTVHFSRIGIRFASLMVPSVSRYQWQFRCFQHLQLKIISRIPEAICWGRRKMRFALTGGHSLSLSLYLTSSLLERWLRFPNSLEL